MPAKKMCSGDDNDDVGDGPYYNCEVNDDNVYYHDNVDDDVDKEHDGDMNDYDNDDSD